jgi:hypothetical protein
MAMPLSTARQRSLLPWLPILDREPRTRKNRKGLSDANAAPACHFA